VVVAVYEGILLRRLVGRDVVRYLQRPDFALLPRIADVVKCADVGVRSGRPLEYRYELGVFGGWRVGGIDFVQNVVGDTFKAKDGEVVSRRV